MTMAYVAKTKRTKQKIFRLSEDEQIAIDRILEKTGLSFQRYIEFKIREDLITEMNKVQEC